MTKLAAYKCPFGYRCAGCADRFRAMALNPNTVVNLISSPVDRAPKPREAVLKLVK